MMAVNYVDVKDVILKKFFIGSKVTFPEISKEEMNVEDMNMGEEGGTMIMIDTERGEKDQGVDQDLEVEIKVINVVDLDQENAIIVTIILNVIDKITKISNIFNVFLLLQIKEEIAIK